MWGYDRDGYDEKGFDRSGIHKVTNEIYDQEGYDKRGYNKDGYDRQGFNRKGIHKVTNEIYDENGYDKDGYNREGYDINGFDRRGIHHETNDKYNPDGYDKKGYDRDGYDEDGYDRQGYDRDGFKNGINRNGMTKEEAEEGKKQRRKNYLGLLDKAEKVASGEMTIEEFILTSKEETTLDTLIELAKRNRMSAEIIRGLYRKKGEYRQKKFKFYKWKYLRETTLIIDGKRVKPTEEDVDKCIEMLKERGHKLLYSKLVTDAIYEYVRLKIKNEPETAKTQIQEKEDMYQRLKAENEEIKDKIQKTRSTLRIKRI